MPFSLILAVAVAAPPDEKAAKVNFKDQVSAIFQSRCNSCHNSDKQKGGLSLDSYGNAMKGGSSGAVIEPGDLEGSRLYELVTHSAEPKMPPNSGKIPDPEIAIIKAWIEAGAPEMSGSAVAAAKPKLDFKLDPSAIGKPVGPPAMPEGVSTEPVVVSARPNAITAMAASPWAPIVAVSGHKQVLIYSTQNSRLVGVLPFPEGTVHVLKFTRDGAMLLAGGGRGGQSGRVVVWDVKTGKRLFEVGKEYEVVLAADISPDRSLVALGGPSKVLKVYGSSDGELVYESKKHTEWVTAIEFSPDGVLLASGDRNGGLVVLGGPHGPRVLRPPRPSGGDHGYFLAAGFEPRGVGQRGHDGPALGDAERQPGQELRGPRRGDALRPVRQGRPARHRGPRPGGEAVRPERRPAEAV